LKLFSKWNACVAKTLFAGIRSANSTAVELTASPETAVVADKGLISVQFPTNFNTSDGDEPGSHFPSAYSIIFFPMLCNWRENLCALSFYGDDRDVSRLQ
jgi:hypothetical protein